MAEYIEREEIGKALNKNILNDSNCPIFVAATVQQIIDCHPAVDVVEVVRCKDCIWWKEPGCAFDTRNPEDIPKENDFCSYGEIR